MMKRDRDMNTNHPMRPQARPIPPQRRPHPAVHHHPKRRPTPWLFWGGSLALGAAILFTVMAVVILMVAASPGSKIANGVTVAGLSVGGQSPQQAEAYLQQNIGAQTVRLTDGDRSWLLSLADLGIGLDVNATLSNAEDAPSNTTVMPWYTVDLNQAQAALFMISDQVNIEPAAGKPGRAIDIPVVLDRLRVNVTGELADGVLDLSMMEVAPPVEETSNQSYDGATTVHVVEQGQELGLIAVMYGVAVNDIVALNDISDPNLLYVGQELIIPAAGLYTPQAPPAPTGSGRSILVDTGAQRIYAYENGQMVHTYLVSTGLPDTPTVLGDYKVYVKYVADDMSGPDYFLPQVPYTMYFYQGYAIHGTYWHNAFGRPMSHGCVNLPVEEAQWFFEFADVGTPVRVI
jgi:lipoprotein-anchoring transpeptidase ErfK/SrfK